MNAFNEFDLPRQQPNRFEEVGQDVASAEAYEQYAAANNLSHEPLEFPPTEKRVVIHAPTARPQLRLIQGSKPE